MKKILATALVIFAVTFAAFKLSPKVFAQNSTNPFSGIIEKLAARFNLKKEDVQKVFDEERAEKQKQMQQTYEEMLNNAVKNGNLTEAQKQLLLKKHEELQKNRAENKNNWQNLSPDERKAAMQKERTDLENWAKQNNIDIKYLFGGFGMGMKTGWGMGGHMKFWK